MKDQKLFFPNLDGLRFIAFFMVFAWHALKTPFDMLHIANPVIHQIFYLFLNGKTGVSIFFVLSGFLITYLVLAEIAVNGSLNVERFYIRRSLRIWPLYFLILFLVFGVMRALMNVTGFNWSEFSMRPELYFFFAGNFDVLRIYLTGGTDFLPSTVTWSVAIEEQFYLCWPLFFWLPARLYKYIFPVLLVVCYVFRTSYAGNEPVLTFHSLSVMGDLALGGWAAYLAFTSNGFRDLFERQSNSFRVLAYGAGLVLMFVLQFVAHDLVQVFSRLVQTVFFAYVILDQNFCRQQKFKFGNYKWITYWGKYTYGLYLWHPLLLLVLSLIVTKFLHLSYQHISTHLLVAPLALAGSLLVSYASYHFFEIYFLKLKHRFGYIRSRHKGPVLNMLKQ